MKQRLIVLVILVVVPFGLFAQESDFRRIKLWSNGAPGFENRKDIREEAKDYWVKNVNDPSLTVVLPEKGKENGCAVLICPGGGHRLLVFNAEGIEPAKFLANLGITVFVLKYRLAREENSPYVLEKVIKQDGYRAMRMIRSLWKEYNIDTNRVGVMGFSAGGEVVSSIAYENGNGDLNSKDFIERINGKPNFQILIYPGPLFIPEVIPHDAPPAFLLVADDDPCCVVSTMSIMNKYRASEVLFEAHIYRKGGHGFNMGNRSDLSSIKSWPNRLSDWLRDNNFFKK